MMEADWTDLKVEYLDRAQVDDYIVSKEDDDILKKWVMIGHHFFSDNVGEIVIPVECCPITIKTDCDNDLIILQSPHDGLQDEINLGRTIDRTDAYRLAGLLIAWASAKHLHAELQKGV